MTPYEALYRRRCRTLLCWQEIDKALTVGSKIIQATTDNIQVIQERMRTAHSCQKSYADRRRRHLEFQVGDQVFLIVSPTKGITRFRMVESLVQDTLGRIQLHKELGK